MKNLEEAEITILEEKAERLKSESLFYFVTHYVQDAKKLAVPFQWLHHYPLVKNLPEPMKVEENADALSQNPVFKSKIIA